MRVIISIALLSLITTSFCLTAIAQEATEEDSYNFTSIDKLPLQTGLPDPFLMSDGSRVRSKEDWSRQRDYLKEMLAHYQYGHMPPRPKDFELTKTLSKQRFDGCAIEEHYVVTLRHNGREASFRMGLIRPTEKQRYPTVIKNCRILFDGEGKAEQTAEYDLTAAREAVTRGYLLCKFIRTDLAADSPDNRQNGIFPLYNEYDWATIAVWAWTYQVVIDALDRLELTDMERIVATGHSRGGKTALCAGIYDERIAITAPNSSGTGGTGSHRYFAPDSREQRISRHTVPFSHWWTPRYFTLAGNEDRIPFDAHTAKALIAPRGQLNTHGLDDDWANPYGTELTYRAAKLVYRWFDAEADIAIHWRPGGHAQREEDWLALLDFADLYFFGKQPKSDFTRLAFPDAKLPIDWTLPTDN